MKLETVNFCGFSPHGSVIFPRRHGKAWLWEQEAGVGVRGGGESASKIILG